MESVHASSEYDDDVKASFTNLGPVADVFPVRDTHDASNEVHSFAGFCRNPWPLWGASVWRDRSAR